MKWFTYILECSDGSFYVGHTQDVQLRLVAHNAGRGADYTAIRRPVKLIYKEAHSSKAETIAREKQIKKWSRAKKQALISGDKDKLHVLTKCRSRVM